MVNKCAAFGCTSGYKRKAQSVDDAAGSQKVTFHSFPLHDKQLCEKWLRANSLREKISCPPKTRGFVRCIFTLVTLWMYIMTPINEGTGLELRRSSTGDTLKTMLYRRFFQMPLRICRPQAVVVGRQSKQLRLDDVNKQRTQCSSWRRRSWLKTTSLMSASQT